MSSYAIDLPVEHSAVRLALKLSNVHASPAVSVEMIPFTPHAVAYVDLCV